MAVGGQRLALGRFASRKGARYTFYRELDGPPVSVSTGVDKRKSLALNGVGTPQSSAPRDSLYRLRHPGRCENENQAAGFNASAL